MAGSLPVNMMASRMGRLPALRVTRSETSTDISSAMMARIANTTASRMTAVETGMGPGKRTVYAAASPAQSARPDVSTR